MPSTCYLLTPLNSFAAEATTYQLYSILFVPLWRPLPSILPHTTPASRLPRSRFGGRLPRRLCRKRNAPPTGGPASRGLRRCRRVHPPDRTVSPPAALRPTLCPRSLRAALWLRRPARSHTRRRWRCRTPNPRIAIGNPLILSPGFPPLHTVREPFSSHGVPS